jgi:hypothetical protein
MMRKSPAFLAPKTSLRVSRAYSGFIAIVLLIITAEAPAPAAVTPGGVQQSQDTGNFYFVDPNGAKSPLEAVTTKLTETGLIVPGERSTVRFPAGTSFKFLIRIPAGAVPRFGELDAEQTYRIFPLNRTGANTVALARERAKYAAAVRFDRAAVADGFVLLTPKERLQPGEYCIGHSQSPDAGCFGVDGVREASGQSAAVASPQPATAEPPTITIGESSTMVLQAMGMPQQMVDLGKKKTYIYKNMKIIFVDDKVTDVQ